MTTEIEQPQHFVNPSTGEALTLAAPTDDLARFLADVRDVESQLREAKRIVSREVLSRMDKTASWTHHFDRLKVTGQSPQPSEEWDGAELREALLQLMDDGELSIEAVDAAVETVISYNVKKAGVNKLRKVGGIVAETVNRLCREVEKDRRVTVTRA